MDTSRSSDGGVIIKFDGAVQISSVDAAASTQQTALQRKALALLLRLEHPEWSDKRIAQEAGYGSPRQLYRMPEYGRLKKAMCDGHGRIPRGMKDSETGRVEAWREDDERE